MNMKLCEVNFNKGKTVAINLGRETRDKYREMLNAVETTEDMARFIVEFEEEKLKYIDLFYEQAGYHFDKADEYCKFNLKLLL